MIEASFASRCRISLDLLLRNYAPTLPTLKPPEAHVELFEIELVAFVLIRFDAVIHDCNVLGPVCRYYSQWIVCERLDCGIYWIKASNQVQLAASIAQDHPRFHLCMSF
jgi:hypothetical protein